jgi:16S rRNA (guanine1516-N2)-methyltransferase
MQPFFVDFCPSIHSRIGKRLHSDNQPNEILLKAISKRGAVTDPPIVMDLTAGFAQDALIMARAASQVHMVERHAIVAQLLDDALRRLKLIAALDETNLHEHEYTTLAHARSLSSRLYLHPGDAISIIQAMTNETGPIENHLQQLQLQQPDICYLDPMFPPRTKSAAVKKNMQILHGLLHSSTSKDEEEEHEYIRIQEEQALLQAALSLAKSRVVVKRPIAAEPLGGKHGTIPSYTLQGSINRWDIYVVS